MDTLTSTSGHLLLSIGLQDLHQESVGWLQDIAFWKTEISFFQKLLEQVNIRVHDLEDKKRIDHFQSLLLYFKGELLDQYRHDLRDHERYLMHLIQNRAQIEEEHYREVHQGFQNQIRAFEADFKQFRLSLYHLAEKYM
ncbi:hypothetical protein GU926_00620 [Nibribacter ruber]|uniref:Hemerythrin-like domain-containing protein n=1 Tax=Nibribacter ruber TaxID=2698458 RepID=A0A6P1NW61_9BACT|nr:hypothetical protein [Nibribacter ruber]QHL86025.1 hypothetical protein GU926_00620 [Nibribacter ruber]